MSLNVLITAGSRRVPLVQAFQRALRATGGGAVVVTDVNPLSPTVYVADRSYQVPMAGDPSYVDALLGICRAERISLLIPTIDDELTLLGEAAAVMKAAGVRVVVSPPEATRVCNDKLQTWGLLESCGIPAAPTWTPGDVPGDAAYPLFIKPRTGRGSVGAFPIRNPRELDFFADYVADPVVQPFLEGPEVTIDVLCDFAGEPIAAVPRERAVIRAGVVDRGRTLHDAGLIATGIRCARAIGAIGAINVQCRIVAGTPTVFEINPRFSGGIPLTIAAGADFPRLIVQLARGQHVAPQIGRFQDGLWMTSYEASVFVADQAVGFSSSCRGAIPEVA